MKILPVVAEWFHTDGQTDRYVESLNITLPTNALIVCHLF